MDHKDQMPREHHQQLRELRPLHLVKTSDGLPVETRRRRGRPRQIVAVAPDQEQYQAQVTEMLEQWIATDEVVTATTRGEGPAGVVSKILGAVAMETAALGYERHRAALEGRDVSELSARRVRALGRLSDLVLLLLQLDGGGQLDLDGKVMAQVEGLWMSLVQETANETLGDPEAFVAQVREAMVGWRGRLRPPSPGWRGASRSARQHDLPGVDPAP
jgi:hypothetical protein